MFSTITIVGVGLIGGSLGLAARKHQVARRIIGVGRNAQNLAVARKLQAIDEGTTDLAVAVRESELVVVCTPVDQIVEHVRAIVAASSPGTLITDAGSTKSEIVKGAEAVIAKQHRAAKRGAEDEFEADEIIQFIGSHPMAGSEKNGVNHARADLFEHRGTIVTPTKNSSPAAVERICSFWEQLGSQVFRMTPAEHDRVVAAMSHVPHVVATALAAATPEACLPLAAGGWLDSTRIAAGDPELWRQILSQNRTHVLKQLEQFERVLATLRNSLESKDDTELLTILAAGKKLRDTVGNRHSSGPRPS